MNKQWRLKPEPAPEPVKELSVALRVGDALARLLVQRGIETKEDAKAFFYPSLVNLHDPYLMKDMDKAVSRLEQAETNGHSVLVYGDYDVDGTSAVSLVYSFFNKIRFKVTPYIPDRSAEGPGISTQGIDQAEKLGCKLIIALDCGIKAIDEVLYAKSKGIDVIICDHHRPGERLPEAFAVLNPKRPDCNYPFKELSGCGVGLKLVQGYCKLKGWDDIAVASEYLDLVAISIAADIVPVMDENRILATHGLKKINSNPRPGIKAFKMFSKKRKLTLSDVVFVIAPRINAAGRINKGIHAVNLLTAENDALAKELALEIDNFNAERKELDSSITEEALSMLAGKNMDEDYAIVICNPSWHKGVIGIVASRLVEHYYRPTFVFTENNGLLCASARSTGGFDIYEAIESCEDIIEQFGGHKFAAGLTIKKENFDEFARRVNKFAREIIKPENRSPELEVDIELPIAEINKQFFRSLKRFSPFGPKNLMPVFVSHNLIDNGWGKSVGKSTQHLKMTLMDAANTGKTYDAIGFKLGEKSELIENGKMFSAVYTIEENEFQGRTSLQLRIRDIKGNPEP